MKGKLALTILAVFLAAGCAKKNFEYRIQKNELEVPVYSLENSLTTKTQREAKVFGIKNNYEFKLTKVDRDDNGICDLAVLETRGPDGSLFQRKIYEDRDGDEAFETHYTDIFFRIASEEGNGEHSYGDSGYIGTDRDIKPDGIYDAVVTGSRSTITNENLEEKLLYGKE